MAEQSRWQQVGGNVAEVYDRHLVPAMMAPSAPRLIKAAGVRPDEHVLDVACGTGVVTRLAAERVGSAGRVVGLDFNAAMLTVALAVAPTPGAPIEWCEASALAMPFSNASFDVVLCQHGLQQFPDRPAALAEMRRVLRSPGRLAACVWGRIEQSPGMAALVAALERHVSVAAANNRRAPFTLSNADELGALVRDAGFHDVSIQTISSTARFASPEKFVEYQLAATPLSTLGGVSDQALGAVVRDVNAALQEYVTEDGLVFPMDVHLATART